MHKAVHKAVYKLVYKSVHNRAIVGAKNAPFFASISAHFQLHQILVWFFKNVLPLGLMIEGH